MCVYVTILKIIWNSTDIYPTFFPTPNLPKIHYVKFKSIKCSTANKLKESKQIGNLVKKWFHW